MPSSVAGSANMLAVLVAGPESKLARQLASLGHRVRPLTAASVDASLERRPADAMFVEVADDLTFIYDLIERWPDIPTIVLLRAAEDEVKLDLVSKGATDVLVAPLGDDELRLVVDRALVRSKALEGRPSAPDYPQSGLLAYSTVMQRLDAQLTKAAQTDSLVLLRGETGTGKGIVAHELHRRRTQGSGPLVTVHVPGLPETLVESELFGYTKGAFTGATQSKPGLVEAAEGGTLFLDEVGDLSLQSQVKTLRLLQDRTYERLGERRTRSTTARFVAATHRDLEDMMANRLFREDLFYRLNVVTLWLPPLRARRTDIIPLAKYFCEQQAKKHSRQPLAFDDDALKYMRAQRWPGNVRELQHVVERVVFMSTGERIGLDDVKAEMAPKSVFTTESVSAESVRGQKLPVPDTELLSSSIHPLREQLQSAERRALVRALEKAKGNRTLAAKLLGIGRRTLYSKLDEHGLGEQQFNGE